MATPIAEAYVEVKARTESAVRGIESLRSSFLKLTAAVGGVYGVERAIRSIISTYANYERELHNVWTLTNATWKEMQKVGEQVRALAPQYGATATTATKALYQIYSASFKGADAIKVLKASLVGAAAGLADVFTAADVTTTILNAYSMSADQAMRVNDILFKVVERGKTTYSELAQYFGRLAAIAAPMGASLTEVAAALATLTRQGVATDEAVTAVRQAIIQLARPTKTVQDIIEKLGYESGIAMIKQKGFAQALAEVVHYAQEHNIALTDAFTNIRAITAILPLATSQAKAYAEDQRAIAESAGAAAEAFSKQTSTLSFHLQKVGAQLSDLGIKLGETFLPAIEGALNAVDTIVGALSRLADIRIQLGFNFSAPGIGGKWAAFIGELRDTLLGASTAAFAGLLIGKLFGAGTLMAKGAILVPLTISMVTTAKFLAGQATGWNNVVSMILQAGQGALWGAIAAALLGLGGPAGLAVTLTAAGIAVSIPLIIKLETILKGGPLPTPEGMVLTKEGWLLPKKFVQEETPGAAPTTNQAQQLATEFTKTWLSAMAKDALKFGQEAAQSWVGTIRNYLNRLIGETATETENLRKQFLSSILQALPSDFSKALLTSLGYSLDLLKKAGQGASKAISGTAKTLDELAQKVAQATEASIKTPLDFLKALGGNVGQLAQESQVASTTVSEALQKALEQLTQLGQTQDQLNKILSKIDFNKPIESGRQLLDLLQQYSRPKDIAAIASTFNQLLSFWKQLAALPEKLRPANAQAIVDQLQAMAGLLPSTTKTWQDYISQIQELISINPAKAYAALQDFFGAFSNVPAALLAGVSAAKSLYNTFQEWLSLPTELQRASGWTREQVESWIEGLKPYAVAQPQVPETEAWLEALKQGTLSVQGFIQNILNAARAGGTTGDALINLQKALQDAYNWLSDLAAAEKQLGLDNTKAAEGAEQLAHILGVEVKKQTDPFQAALEKITEASSSAAEQIKALARGAKPDQLIALNRKISDLISSAEQLYEAETRLGLPTQGTVEALEEFMQALNFSSQEIQDVISRLTGKIAQPTGVEAWVQAVEQGQMSLQDFISNITNAAASGSLTNEQLINLYNALQTVYDWETSLAQAQAALTGSTTVSSEALQQLATLLGTSLPEMFDTFQTTLSGLTEPSAEAGEKLRELAQNATPEQLIALKSKAEELVQQAGELYQAQQYFGLSTEETTQALQAFLEALGLAPEQIEAAMASITGAAESAAASLSSLVSQAEALTLSQASQIQALQAQALQVLQTGKVVTAEGKTREATIGELLAAASSLRTFQSSLSPLTDVLERLYNSGKLTDEQFHRLYDTAEELSKQFQLGLNFEEQQRAQEEAERKRKAALEEAIRQEKAKEAELKRQQEEAAREAVRAWKKAFEAPIQRAIETGKWFEAAQAIREIAKHRDDLIKEAKALPKVQGETLQLADVFDLITRSQQELLTTLDSVIKVMTIAGEDTTALEELKLKIEALFDPLKAWKLALEDVIQKFSQLPWQAGLAARELYLRALGSTPTPVRAHPFQKGGIVKKPTIALVGEAGPEAIIPLSKGLGAQNFAAIAAVASEMQQLKNPMQHFYDNMKALAEVDPEFAKRWSDFFKQGCHACGKAASNAAQSLDDAAAGSKVIAEIMEKAFGDALQDTTKNLRPSAEAAAAVAEEAKNQIQAYESLISDMELFGLDTRGVRKQLLEFKAGLQGLTPQMYMLAQSLQNLSESLVRTFVDALFDWLGELLSGTEKASEALGSLNVPAGFKAARYEYAAAKPGQPYKEPEKGGGLLGVFKKLLEAFLSWLKEQVANWLNSLLQGFSWANFVESLDWGAFIRALGWADFIKWLSWGDWISALNWGNFLSILDWTKWINPLNWPQLLGDVAGALTATLNAAIEAVIGPVSEALAGFLEGLVTVTGAFVVLGTALGFIEAAIAVLVGAIQGIGEAIQSFLQPITEQLAQSWQDLQPLIQAVSDLFSSLSPILGAFGRAIADGIRVAVELVAALAPLIQAVADVVNIISKLLAPAIDMIAKLFEITLVAAITPLVAIAKALGAALKLLEQVVEWIADFLKGIINGIIDVFNAIIDVINWALGWLGVNIPKIPHLERGGLVTGPTVAMIGEAGPELVVPLDKIPVAAGISDRPLEVHVVVELDGRQISSAVYRYESLANTRLIGISQGTAYRRR